HPRRDPRPRGGMPSGRRRSPDVSPNQDQVAVPCDRGHIGCPHRGHRPPRPRLPCPEVPHMSVPRRAWARRPASIALAVVTMSALTILPSSTLAAPAPDSSSAPTTLYLVQFAGNPLTTYTGGVAGFTATRPSAGHRINTHTANA